MNSKVLKTDRSHSEVGDTLRYFNSVSSSKSWCGEEYFQVHNVRFTEFRGNPLSGKLTLLPEDALPFWLYKAF